MPSKEERRDALKLVYESARGCAKCPEFVATRTQVVFVGEVGLERGDVFITNVLLCRPPGNRDPNPVEIDNCQDYLMRELELIEPSVVCTLGNFATKLLRGDTTGITRVHGQAEIRVIGTRAVQLYPLYHPAAALYTPRMLEVLREDFGRIPALLAQGAPDQPVTEEPELVVEPEERAVPEPAVPVADQLDLF